MAKQSHVVTSTDSAAKQGAAALKTGGQARVATQAVRWKGLGRASGVFTAGQLTALLAPREAKAVGYFVDNSVNSIPPNGVVCPESSKGCYTSWMMLADLDGNGTLDQLWANGGGYYVPGTVAESSILLNNGVGVFTDVTPSGFGAAASRLRQEAVADVDGDGDLDIYQPGGFGMDLDKLWI